jgi:hypothetical protein
MTDDLDDEPNDEMAQAVVAIGLDLLAKSDDASAKDAVLRVLADWIAETEPDYSDALCDLLVPVLRESEEQRAKGSVA